MYDDPVSGEPVRAPVVRCTDCHRSEPDLAPEAVGLATAERDLTHMLEVTSLTARAERMLLAARRGGVEVRQPTQDIDQAVDAQIELEVLVHTFSSDEDGAFEKKYVEGRQHAGAALDGAAKALDELAFRRRGLMITLAVIALALVGLALKIRQLGYLSAAAQTTNRRRATAPREVPMNREDRLDRLEVEVRSLQQVLERLEDRLRAVEGGALPAAGVVPAGAETAAEAAPDGMPAPAEPGGIPAGATDHAGRAFLGDLGLVGRTLMVLGGAFLLRAVTETPSVPDAAGVGLGLAYALLWLALAWRVAGRRPASHSATYHALAYSLIAFPLVAEAVLRFAVLPAAAGAAVLAAVTAAGLAVAVHRSRRLAGWLVTVAAVGAAAVLLVASSQPAAYCAFLLTLGIAALWLGERHAWRGLRWPTAAAADAALLLPLVLLGHDRWPAGSGILLALQLALLVSYAATFSWRGVTREAWRVGPFALLQTCAALAVGYGGAVWVAHRVTEDTGAVAAAGLVLAVAALTAAALLLGRRAERRNAFLYHAAVGCPLLLGATGLLLPNAAEALLWSILAVLLAVAAARLVSVTLAAMAALFAVSAATTGGLLGAGFWSLAAPAARPWPPLGAAPWWSSPRRW